MKLAALLCVVVLALAVFAAQSPQAPAGAEAFLGAWDIVIPGGAGRPARNCWLEIKREGDNLTGRFLAGGGDPGPLGEVTVENGELRFMQRTRPSRANAQSAAGAQAPPARPVYRAVLKDGKLAGTLTQGDRPPIQWTGVRPPKWPDQAPARKPGKAVALFNGKDLAGWLPQNPDPSRKLDPPPLGWQVIDGSMTNTPHFAYNLYSERKFMDFRLEVEFKVETGSNSGVYLRGRHEIQIEDDYGKQPSTLTHGAIYGFVAPSEEASKPVGEWQTLEATIVGNRVTIIMNGKKIHDNVAIPAITGGALDATEGEPGPILLQGDHSKIYYRKVVVTPLI